ncbi:FecR family protein [Mucilaginibacter gracilis]|uniref:FecR family protein n=1 Tax=Mucilaginibacter gracilis TaxID=423350 RepID=A0A495IZI9_9SPHI|nr:FecR domain-containing protein [Mucilaginibacter gracilis]RKR82107.1 FecR family protein [Mucilaginibacter gracilis]
METQDKQLKKLAEKYEAGLCTPEEVKLVRDWYDSFETEGYPLPPDQEIKRAAEEATTRAVHWVAAQQRPARIRNLWLPVLKVAAVLLLLSSAGMLIFKATHPDQQRMVWRQESTAPGVKKQVTLPDGSLISLNSGSTITYPETFSKTTRDLKLSGEAFFTVVHDSRHPFIVHTGQLRVQVLGTSYNIQAYPGETPTTVAVATGKVGLWGTGDKIKKVYMLTPGEQMTYNSSLKSFVKSSLPLADIGSWQQNVLDFRMETLENISKSLSREYGVTFVFKDRSLLNKRFRLKVKKESLANILKLLSISGGNFPYHISGKTVTIG